MLTAIKQHHSVHAVLIYCIPTFHGEQKLNAAGNRLSMLGIKLATSVAKSKQMKQKLRLIIIIGFALLLNICLVSSLL